MHDWTLNSISIDWQSGCAVCRLEGPDAQASLVANGLRELRLPRKFSWGPSVSVNRVTGPIQKSAGLSLISIEMQSGDIIEIEASSFNLPQPQP